MEPNTVYGISKQAGERWNEYYFNKFGVDIRSLRYPGLVGWRAKAGGGTTDYAVNIFHESILKGKYECFLKEDTALPMMYMPDAIRATIELMESPAEKIKIRSSYNLSAMSFTPKEIAEEIKKHYPEFTIDYNPDFRQKIADSRPASIDDAHARADWERCAARHSVSRRLVDRGVLAAAPDRSHYRAQGCRRGSYPPPAEFAGETRAKALVTRDQARGL